MLLMTLIGVACFLKTPCYADQLETSDAPTLDNARERQIDTPEVVLQLKYDGGELNRIYLTQFRKEVKMNPAAVLSRTELCSDLCSAGLGGLPCGEMCSKMVPVGLQMALLNENSTEIAYGLPRVDVCPALCQYNLGDPLCNCNHEALARPVDWTSVCSVFCVTDRYVLNGCPVCEDSTSTTPTVQAKSARILTTSEGWQSWCNVQCRQGQGGAACNCDRAPFL